jgi:hypothetical protein
MTEAVMDRIKADQLRARKSRDVVIENVLDQVMDECEARHSLQPMRSLTDSEVISVVRKVSNDLVSNVLDKRVTTATRRAQIKRKVDHLQRYIPSDDLSDEDIEEIAVRLHAVMGFKQILDHLRARYPGRYNHNHATLIVRQIVNA